MLTLLAPVLMLIHTPRYMGPPQWSDIGMWLQTVMLLLNKAKEPRRVDMTRFREALGGNSEGRDVLSGQTLRWGESLELPARSALLLELR